MTELTFERRTANALVLLDENGNEFLLPADEALLSEVRAIVAAQRGIKKVRPAEIQKLLRQGLSAQEVAAETGFDIDDIERFAPPVLAEMEYILERAFEVTVRTKTAAITDDEKFGEVISERLFALAAEHPTWRSWKDEETGWHIGLEFISYGVLHNAVWRFDHNKLLLTANNADAVNLSKQQLNDTLIPAKPRALPETPKSTAAVTAFPELPPHSAAEEQLDVEFGDFTHPADDLGETANLLEALRQRRSEREQHLQETSQLEILEPPLWETMPQANTTEQQVIKTENTSEITAAEAAGYEPLSSVTKPLTANISAVTNAADTVNTPNAAETKNLNVTSSDTSSVETAEKPKKKGRTAIPSWDEILFGTRSDEEP